MFKCDNVSKIYRKGSREVRALDEVSLRIESGEFVVIRGPSGSGKTTLLLAIGAMLRPSLGRVMIDDTDIYAMGDRDRARFRAEHIGFVFQMFHLVQYLTVFDNVLMPATSERGDEKRRVARGLLDRLGLANREQHTPVELSAGERQRVAIARALVGHPSLILADEPTGNLDPDNATEVLEHLTSFNKDGGTVVFVTHGTVADDRADRILHLRDGRLDGLQETD